MRPLVFLDTETTSLGPKREAWEVAMIRRADGGQGGTSFFISDLHLEKADPMSLKIGGFYDRHPRSKLFTPADLGNDQSLPEGVKYSWDAAEVIEQWTRNAIIVGAVPNFDTEVLGRLLRRNGYLPAWHYHLIDVENLALGWLISRDPQGGYQKWLDRSYDSDDLSRSWGGEPPSEEERHTALGDARWAQRWYDAITDP